jgi:hypothetical protein
LKLYLFSDFLEGVAIMRVLVVSYALTVTENWYDFAKPDA